MRNIGAKRKIVFFLCLVLTIVWMAVIYGFSDSDGEKSKTHSRGISETVAHTLAPEYEIPEKYVEGDFFFVVVKTVRKSAHIIAYALLGALSYFTAGALRWLPQNKLLPCAVSVPVCILYAISDEIHQTFIEGRYGSANDVLIDTAGIALGTAIAALVVWLFGYIVRK